MSGDGADALLQQARYRDLRDALFVLASPASTQRTLATELPTVIGDVEDMLLDYGCAHLAVPGLHQAGLIDDDAIHVLDRVSDFFEGCAEEPSLCHVKALETDLFWELARCMAGAALIALGELPERTDLEPS